MALICAPSHILKPVYGVPERQFAVLRDRMNRGAPDVAADLVEAEQDVAADVGHAPNRVALQDQADVAADYAGDLAAVGEVLIVALALREPSTIRRCSHRSTRAVDLAVALVPTTKLLTTAIASNFGGDPQQRHRIVSRLILTIWSLLVRNGEFAELDEPPPRPHPAGVAVPISRPPDAVLPIQRVAVPAMSDHAPEGATKLLRPHGPGSAGLCATHCPTGR
jgi:hypothetical protein